MVVHELDIIIQMEKGHLLEIHLLEKLLDTKISTVRADDKKNETARKPPKKSFRADAIFRPK